MGRIKTIQASTGTSAGTVSGIDGTATAKSADYTVLDTDRIRTVLMTTGASNKTVTLPTAADNAHRFITIKKVDSGAGAVIVDGEGAETIDGATTQTLFKQYGQVSLQCDGTGWVCIEGPIDYGTAALTITGVANVASNANASFQFYRIKNMVTVSGSYDLNTTAAAGTDTSFTVSLPIASNFTTIRQLGGSFQPGTEGSPTATESGSMLASIAGDNASCTFKAYSTTNRSYSMSFSYVIA